MTTLPRDLILDEILPRLPAKSLVRFKCVSKEFEALISSPKFTNLHLRHSLSSDSNRLLIADIVLDGGGVLHIFDLDTMETPPKELRLPDTFKPNSEDPIVGSCNGLLVIRNFERTQFLLINPSTGFYNPYLNRTGWLIHCSLYGFGYDALADVYIIVGVHKVRENNPDVVVKIETYGKSLKFITAQLSTRMIPIFDGAVLVDNHLCHWLLWYPLGKNICKYRIVCFDICNSQGWTRDIALPDYDHHKPNFALGVLKGCLCLLSHSIREVWVMKEYGVKESWVRLLGLDELGVSICTPPLAYGIGSSCSEILVLLDNGDGLHERELMWYNTGNKQLKSATNSKVRNRPRVFKGSLVLVPGEREGDTQI